MKSLHKFCLQTNILHNIKATNEIGSKCYSEPDTVGHCLWLCMLENCKYSENKCKIFEDISMIPNILGCRDNEGLNHKCLEGKKDLIYN